MTPEFRETKNAIREALATLPTQRLAEILAFAQDGKMNFDDGCCCIKGVAFARSLHVSNHEGPICPESENGNRQHYWKLAGNILWESAENAYLDLGLVGESKLWDKSRCDRRFIAIVRAALKLRMRTTKQPEPVTAEVRA